MSENMFSASLTPLQVMIRYGNIYSGDNSYTFDERTAIATDALARIAELTPPKDENLRDHAEHILRVHGLLNPTPRTVDEGARERAREVTYDWWLNTTGMSRANADQLVDRIIDALGWTAPATELEDCWCGIGTDAECPACFKLHCPQCFDCCRDESVEETGPTPAPATPAVELDLTALDHIRGVLARYENLRAAMVDQPMFGDMPDITIPGDLPMRITMDDNGVSVLRIGGCDE